MESIAAPSSLLHSLRRAWAEWFSSRAPLPVLAQPAPAPDAALAPVRDPFAPFAELLGVPVPAASDDARDEVAIGEDEEWTARVLEHFTRHPPLPASAPSVSLQALGLVAEPATDFRQLVRVICSDPALAAGVVATANSALYRAVREMETVREAVVRLGLNEAAKVTGALAARSLFHPRMRSERGAYAEQAARLYVHAVAVANTAAGLALRVRGGRPDRAFLGGMLFDVGRVMALRSFCALASENGAPAPVETVERVLEAVHVELGGACHQAWGLPQYLGELVLLHHDAEVPAEPEFVDLHVVRLCGALLDLRNPGTAHRGAHELVQSASALGLSPREVRVVDTELREALVRAEALHAIR